MDSKELREKFIKFFVDKGHQEMPPASLIPENDPSVLFTTAGMQQFKRFYTDSKEAPAKNVVTCQPCFRTSDIEEVGDNTHLTFFEMLGNFSFGGYFKEEAIKWGYEFLTQELEIEPNRIWCSVFVGDKINPRDNESAKILDSMGIKYKEFPREDCFWGPTGDEGPCGPDVEMFVDDVEVWTLVFNEYYKSSDGSYRPLETKGVDTGMGLERMLVVLNNKNDVYETDLFWPIIKEIEKISNLKYGDKKDEEYIKDDKQCWVDVRKNFRIIADHFKSSVFLISEKIIPSNKERGYVARRLIRKCLEQLYLLVGDKLKYPFDKFHPVLAQIYSEIYPEIKKENVLHELKTEGDRYAEKLLYSYKFFTDIKLNGQELFYLYQSHGYSPELIFSLQKNRYKINYSASEKHKIMEEFNQLLKRHQELSRSASAGMFKGGLASGGEIETKLHTATHLLLAALREILGKDVNQKGANITTERIRFDFNYPEKLSDEQIKQVEDWVNDKISQNTDVQMEEMPLSKALEIGATSIPGFKYPETVKVFSIGTISKEICGGPHVKNTSELGHFKIIKEESSSAGIRRIKAVLE